MKVFSPEAWGALLQFALYTGYRITCFADFTPPTEDPAENPVLLLRHDLDHSIQAAAVLAAIEAELGLRSTFFVQVRCPFYNLLSPESGRLLRQLTAMGHEIGLHYEADRYRGPSGAARLALDVALLADVAEQPIISASQHLPSVEGPVALGAPIRHEAYAPRFTQAPMSYVSDSLMVWRQATPWDLLAERRSFQLLTHPMKWWRPQSSMAAALHCAVEAEVATLRAETAAAEQRYARMLQDRPRLDVAFKAVRETV